MKAWVKSSPEVFQMYAYILDDEFDLGKIPEHGILPKV